MPASGEQVHRMTFEKVRPSRRALLTAVALAPLAGCATDGGANTPASAGPGHPHSANSAVPSRPAVPDLSRFVALEREHRARLGVYALATGTGATVTYRADERFALCSTFKTLAAAAVLDRYPLSHLDKRVTYTSADVDSISPITKNHIATGMTIRQLCDAAIRHSDGTAGNLLVRDIGGPAQLTAYLRGLGDGTSRMDHYEPELNRGRPNDPADTTTPRAVATDYRALVLGDALPAAKRTLLSGWLTNNTANPARIRAALPKGWKAADKTGTGDYGRGADIAIVWPPHTPPLVLAVMSDRAGYTTPADDSLIVEATRQILPILT